jgi:hypothetical protein
MINHNDVVEPPTPAPEQPLPPGWEGKNLNIFLGF